MVNLLENWLIINIISIEMKNQTVFRIKITNFVPILDKRMQTVKLNGQNLSSSTQGDQTASPSQVSSLMRLQRKKVIPILMAMGR